MPVKSSTNNRILPANSRASDVASRAVQEFLPAQQTRNMNAMRVQGYAGLLYNRLKQGRKCTCQASEARLGSRLGLDGKAKPGVINELLTGQTVFDVTPYGASPTRRLDPFDSQTSPHAPVNKYQGVFDVIGTEEGSSLPMRVVDEPDFGDNGPVNPDFDIDTLAGEFNASAVGSTDAACGVCYGSGFIGGYTPFHGNRTVVTVDQVELGASVIDTLASPWAANSPEGFEFTTVLPYGAIGVDCFRVLNNTRPIAANFTVDGQAVNAISILGKCDGRPHLIRVTLNREVVWTHMEIQFITSKESAFFEFPKLTKGNDTAMLEQLEPFSIIMGSNVPELRPEDIITESTFGKTLIVENSNWWNTRNRNVLGWECQVRVLQPPEIMNNLPKRGRIATKAPTANGQHDNSTGAYRT